MKSNQYWTAIGRTLAVAIATAIVILVLAPGMWAASAKTLHTFTGGGDGAYPHDFGALIFDASGNLYGTATEGGNGGCFRWNVGCGVVFKLAPQPDGSWTETVLYNFTGADDGSYPAASLIFDAAGALYGTAMAGGAYNAGVVFKLTPNPDGSWTETVMHSFNGTDGSTPVASLVFDADGNLYSATQYGGAYGCGTVFELSPNGGSENWAEKVLHSFTCHKDGAWPQGPLIFDSTGSLYGTTTGGGNPTCYVYVPGCGVVFKLTPNPDGTWTERTLHKFRGGFSGEQPGAPRLIFDTAGNLYGTNCFGGAFGWGNVFKLSPNPDGTWKEKVLHQFRGPDGNNPVGGVIFDAAGNLYGTTYGGGVSGWGVVFKLTLGEDGKWREKMLHQFVGHPGAILPSGLIFDAAGNLYGVTRGYPVAGYGSVFEITP
jgi:uncharacterized repeat protein (TIGR03803 family)